MFGWGWMPRWRCPSSQVECFSSRRDSLQLLELTSETDLFDVPPADRSAAHRELENSSTRRAYLDWMRGLAVLIMIEAHVIDSWTGGADRDGVGFGWSLILGGFGAPLFLFLAGVTVA